MRTVESFDKHYSFIIAILFYKNRLSLTEENKKQEPCRQHSAMSSIKTQNQKIVLKILNKVFKKCGSMKPIVREVCADSSNSNKLGFWNGF